MVRKRNIKLLISLMVSLTILFSLCSPVAADTVNYEDVSQNGIFYIKSCKDTYLTLNEDGTIKFTDYTGDNNQMWITEKYDTKSNYVIRPAFGNINDSISIGSSLASTYVSETKIGNTPMRFKFYSTDDRSDVFIYSNGNYYLNCSENNLYAYFKTSSNLVPTDDNYYFTLEKIEYQIGDINMDGRIDIMDVTDMQIVLSDYDNCYAIQKYLGDVNNDGLFDINDVSYLQLQLAY